MRATIYTVIALLLVGCSQNDAEKTNVSSKSTEVPEPGGSVVRRLESECNTLNWVLYTTVSEMNVLRLVYDYLLDYDENLDIVPVLAKRFKVDDDNLRITVELRDSIYWHDGTPITSADIAFTVDKIRDPAAPSVNKSGWFEKLEKLEVVDERTVVFVWSEKYAPALHALALFAPIPKHIYATGDFLNHPANRAPVGSGPFKFEEWKTGQTISVVRSDGYYGNKAYLDRVVFRVVPDQATALSALKAGELDEMRMYQGPWDAQNDEAFLDRFEKKPFYVPQYNYLAWNCRTMWFKDKRVRRAMTMLFDRKSIIEKIYSGYAKPVSGPFYVNSPANDPSIEPLAFDPAAAKKLLDEAGWKDSDGDGTRDKDSIKFEFELNVSGGSSMSMSFAELLQEECAKAGVSVKIRPLESSTFFGKAFKGEYDAAILAWRLENDPDVYDTFHSSQVPPIGLNHTFYSNHDVDELLNLARVEFDKDKRNEYHHRIHQLIHEDQPYTFINNVPDKRAFNKRIGNIQSSPTGPFDFHPGANYWYVKSSIVGANN